MRKGSKTEHCREQILKNKTESKKFLEKKKKKELEWHGDQG